MYARACLIATKASPQNRMSKISDACRVQPRSGPADNAISGEVAGAIKRGGRRPDPTTGLQDVHVREVGHRGLEPVGGGGGSAHAPPAQLPLPAFQHLRVVRI